MSAAPAYVEFSTQSNFSFLRGASTPEELVVGAHALGHAAIGIADRNTVAGVVRGWSQSRHILFMKGYAPATLPYHPGCRLSFCDGTSDILAYPQDRQGWGHLCRLLTQANLRPESEKGAPHLFLADLLEWGDGMSLAVLPDPAVSTSARLALLRQLRDRFGKVVRVAAHASYEGSDRFAIEQAAALAKAAGLPLMAVNNVLYHVPERRPLADTLTAIRLKTTVMEAGLALSQNAERHLKRRAEMARLFRKHPQALQETIRFAEELSFSLGELKYHHPKETVEGVSAQAELERLTWEGARKRYPTGIPQKIVDNIEEELPIIAKLGCADYFLTVRDIVSFARSKGILCQGRGSAANSTICYCMEITEVNPMISGLLFARFLSVERGEPPDIDVDFEHEERDPVMEYVYDKYSGRRTALAAAVTSYRSRSAVREISKALGLSADVTDALSGMVKGWWTEKLTDREVKEAGLDAKEPLIGKVMELTDAIKGFPRHLTQHVGGFVITEDRLDEVVPIMKTAMPSRTMVEWDKDDLDAIGLLKVDVLALGMLTCLKRCFKFLGAHYPDHGLRSLDVNGVQADHQDDNDVYKMIQRADTLGVFQIESRAQMSMLPRLKPRTFYDLVIEVAIVRPGPIQGDMVHPYLRRREGIDPVVYPSPVLENILGRTLGVPLFQEQAMAIAIEAGGFTPAKADKLRRAMATFKRVGTIDQLKAELVEGMVSRGYEREFAERCFSQIEGFGEYGFPESHAASFALLVYASCWFKAYYPDVFCAAILNSQPMGFYAPSQLVRDAREHGVEVRPPDVNESDWDCVLEKAPFDPDRIARKHESMRGVIRSRHAVRLGLRQVKGLHKKDCSRLEQVRGDGFVSVRDVWLRCRFSVETMEQLARADAFRSLGLDRRAALWEVQALDRAGTGSTMPLLDNAGDLSEREQKTHLPAMPSGQHVIEDYRSLSMSLKAHPVAFLRDGLAADGVRSSAELGNAANGQRFSVAGLVLVRQRPGTAKGVIFMTIEDETGIANIVVWKKTFERFRPIVLGARLVKVTGKVQTVVGKEPGSTAVIHVVAHRIEDMSRRLAELSETYEGVDFRSPTDEVKRPVEEDHRVLSKLRSAQRQAIARRHPRDQGDIVDAIEKVMPGGRNFH
ncbi:MAG: error-prone DNA polymerase [Rhizobiaceae bacterium]|nr:error-prone DNA polymerase [Rhizobiaceae bacterium]